MGSRWSCRDRTVSPERLRKKEKTIKETVCQEACMRVSYVRTSIRRVLIWMMDSGFMAPGTTMFDWSSTSEFATSSWPSTLAYAEKINEDHKERYKHKQLLTINLSTVSNSA